MKKIILIIILGLATAQIAVAYPGSYKQSCRACYTQRGTLYCKCQRANGRWRRTQVDRHKRCRKIVNNNGRLACKGNGNGRPHHGNRPRPQPPRHKPQPQQNSPKQIRKDVRKGNWTPNQLLNG